MFAPQTVIILPTDSGVGFQGQTAEMDALRASAGPGSTPNRFPVEFRSTLVPGPLSIFSIATAFCSAGEQCQCSVPRVRLKMYSLMPEKRGTENAFLDCGSATAGSGAYRHTIYSLSNSPWNNLWLVGNNLWQRGEISVLLECPRPLWTFNSFKSN